MSTRKPRTFHDPMAPREAIKYEFPVPSREAVLAYLEQAGELTSFKQLARALGVVGERDLDSFERRLRAMERDGQVLRNRRGCYGLPEKMDMVRGRIVGHPDGYGFLITDEGGDDLFISPREMRQVLHGDRAVVRETRVDARGRRECSIIEVLERAQKTVVGRYFLEDGLGFVVPEDKRIAQDIFIAPENAGLARRGQIVMAEILEQPTLHRQPVGRIAEIIGDHMAPGMEIEIAIRKHSLPHVWPEAVLEEAARLSPEVPEADKRGREDLTHLPLVTIDGEDARDFDDAVYCERVRGGWRLIVAIADVSRYVLPATALDVEARNRGNSVYFPKSVIPMLPEVLSNGLCSLRPHVDRLCIACEMRINQKGMILDYQFFEAVMHSHARLTYNKVAAILVERNAELRSEYAELLPHLEDLYALFKALQTARARRGAIDFELPETRIVFDAERKIEYIEPLVRNDAHKLIEECMLAANVCAAEYLGEHDVPALYRVHAGPTTEKLLELRQFLFEFGLTLGGGDEPKAPDYARLLKKLEPGPEGRLVHTMLLRSLSQAVYSAENSGHFALSYPRYTHFTSPIRRYPDLLVHRAIKQMLGRHRAHPDADPRHQTAAAGEHCSMTERRADDATRDVIRWLKTEFMMDKVGDEFVGIVSGVTGFGLFVELAEIYVDGLVHISSLGNDYYHFDPGKQRLLGERTRQSYRLGDSVRVRLVRVNLDEAKLDFELVKAVQEKREKRARKVRPKRRKSQQRGSKKKRR